MSDTDFKSNETIVSIGTTGEFLRDDTTNKCHFYRLADIENNTIKLPPDDLSLNEIQEWKFRKRIFTDPNDKHSNPDGHLGVWKWSVDEYGRVRSYYDEGIHLNEIIILKNVNSIQELTKQLCNGISYSKYNDITKIVCFNSYDGKYEGVVCTSNDYSIKTGKLILNDDIYTLPYYSFLSDAIIQVGSEKFNNDYLFYRYIEDIVSRQYIPTRELQEFIKMQLIEMCSNKRIIAGELTRKEGQKLREYIKRIPKASLYEKIKSIYRIEEDKAIDAVDEILASLNSQLIIPTPDTELVDEIIETHDVLRNSIEKRIKEKYQAKFTQEEQNLNELSEKANAISSQIKDLEKRKQDLEASISEDEKKQSEQENKMSQDSATKFLPAESAYLSTFESKSKLAGENKTWDDEVLQFASMLEKIGFCDAYSEPFAALIYNAVFNVQKPILLIGPRAECIAEAFSNIVFTKPSYYFPIRQDFLNKMNSIVSSYEGVFNISGLFESNIAAHIDQLQCDLKHVIFLTHPFIEDLTLLPKSINNYVITLYTEPFIKSWETDITYERFTRNKNFEPFEFESSEQFSAKEYILQNNSGVNYLFTDALSKLVKGICKMRYDSNLLSMLMLGLYLPYFYMIGKSQDLIEIINQSGKVSRETKEYIQGFIG
ncbi:MAG: hypothetical protein LKE33_01425 [Acidaminococcus sp.]|nr:hypothetical protein [Acidaminococcus sp.]MCI2099655.1 hypothetical protein [Acidaminococcus sp.]MCI2113940.1 hypothetical protein [Acidaminococcus sp.]MCI2115823.1 hypothetical protein [Acidaminococcus sp.]